MAKLTFEEFNRANMARKKQFFKNATADDWSISDCFMAAAGELGEIANALKKVRRAQLGMLNKNEEGRQIDSLDDAKAKVAGEIGGFMCYLDQLTDMIGLRLEDCIVDEFNKKSEELGLPERIIDGEFILIDESIKQLASDIGVTGTQLAEDIHRSKYGERSIKGLPCPKCGSFSGMCPRKANSTVQECVQGCTVDEKMKLQSDEFDAVKKLADAYQAITLTPIVDDDYPMVRGRYEGAMMDFLRAVRKNGRTLPPWR